MSNYDYRDRPAYRADKVGSTYSKNRCILKWWTPEHDDIIKAEIAAKQWLWYWSITDRIIEHTQPEVIEKWKDSDPVCKQYAWYNVLMYFAMSRAETLGFVDKIRTPTWKVCPLCNQRFVENSLPVPLIKRLGMDNLDFCSPCLRDTVLQNTGDNFASAENIAQYFQDLSSLLGRVPPQGFGEGMQDLLDLSREERLELLILLQRKPTITRVKELFGSWLNALIQAGVLEDGTRRTNRGTQTIAKDGHICLSLGEKTIDDFLFMQGIAHEKEPKYPEGNYRADFKVGNTFLEYFGLSGDPEYDAKTKEKMRICKKHKIELVAIYPQDLTSQERIEKKLALLPRASSSR